ncbi:MAG: hypothetical protein HC897_06680 [Thermoanaerobaculia bacterium]|nr:hypothetical protein [Thermoanaerobaculia bacterium]
MQALEEKIATEHEVFELRGDGQFDAEQVRLAEMDKETTDVKRRQRRGADAEGFELAGGGFGHGDARLEGRKPSRCARGRQAIVVSW